MVNKKLGPTQFIGDYGVAYLDGWERDGAPKAEFQLEGRRLLEALKKLIKAEKHFLRRGKSTRALSWNPGGPGVGGDHSACFFRGGETVGIYVTLCSGSPILGVRASRSGVNLMWRVTRLSDPYGGGRNRWENFDIPLDELATKMIKALEQTAPVNIAPINTTPADKSDLSRARAAPLVPPLGNPCAALHRNGAAQHDATNAYQGYGLL